MMPIKIPSDLVEGSECLDCEVPWMTEAAIYKLDELLKEDDSVLEFGSGGSTIFFSKRCLIVFSVETSQEWGSNVLRSIYINGLTNVAYEVWDKEEKIIELARHGSFSSMTVVSVDTQGGYNRSAILNAFLEKGISPSLRMIILDNYSHEGLFPDHWDKENIMGEGWEVLTFDQPDGRWAGKGTRILLKK